MKIRRSFIPRIDSTPNSDGLVELDIARHATSTWARWSVPCTGAIMRVAIIGKMGEIVDLDGRQNSYRELHRIKLRIPIPWPPHAYKSL
jgi:hypothetical protein